MTGLLVVGGRRFLQVLEGPEPAVRATYERIGRDSPHHGLVVLNDRAISDRSFPDWWMGFEKGGDTPEGSSLKDQIAEIIAPIEDATLKAYFEGFSKSHSAR